MRPASPTSGRSPGRPSGAHAGQRARTAGNAERRELASAGVRRVSTGSLLAGAAYGALLEGARELRDEGTSRYAEHGVSRDVLKTAFEHGKSPVTVTYVPADDRYERMRYRRSGRSGLQLPAISLGLWQNFGDDRPLDDRAARSSAARSTSASRTSTSRTTTGRRTARPRRTSAGSAARISRPYRDELIISTKAGYDMWPGPYGEWGSRKYLLASLDQSLRRMGLDYVDIFYSHRFDPDTPLEETMGALDTRGPAGQGALRRHLVLLGSEDARGARRSCASSARRS